MADRCFRRMAIIAALTVGLAGVARAGDDATEPKAGVRIGDRVADFTFKDIRYLPRTLDELGERQAYVIVFTTIDCPLVQRYLPRVNELEEAYRDQGVQFVAINVGPGDSIVEMAHQAVKVDAAFPFVKDFDGDAVRALGVSRTPEAVVLDADRRLRYRGRIDSQYRLGGVKPSRGREDLKEAIDDVLAGREVSVAETPVDGCKITLPEYRQPDEPVTFAEHIAPIMQAHCQDCHHEGSIGPFPLVEYEDVTAFAEMVAEVVRERRMPPSYASKEHGHFINRLEMSPQEIASVIHWVRGGMPLGDVEKMPEPREFAKSEWRIDEPDLVITMSKPAKLPAHGYIPYKYAILPYTFQHDTWVQQVEILPSNRAAQHHCNLAYLRPGKGLSFSEDDAVFITGQVPGGDPMQLSDGVGFCIPKGAMLILQLHYVTTGEETEDQTSVGLVFAKERIQKELRHFQITDNKFAIPPHASHHRVTARRTFEHDAIGVGMFVHMHLRGKDMTFRAIYPEGKDEMLLSVPNYNFDWQMAYVWEKGAQRFPAGTHVECVAHYDNSAFNPYNPDPEDTVRHGPQTYHEMMFGFLFYLDANEELNLDIDPSTGKVLSVPDPTDQAQSD